MMEMQGRPEVASAKKADVSLESGPQSPTQNRTKVCRGAYACLCIPTYSTPMRIAAWSLWESMHSRGSQVSRKVSPEKRRVLRQLGQPGCKKRQ